MLLALAARPAAAGVEVKGRQMLVDGKPFEVRGVCYSPTPINESVYFVPHGDYFTSDYSFIWQRDLPLIKAMGANMLRVYGWLPENDHSDFLDAVHENGLKAMATFFMGDASESPVGSESDRDKVIDKFTKQVAQYATKPALIIWSFGNELNGVWNGYLQQLGHDPSAPCAWDDRCDAAPEFPPLISLHPALSHSAQSFPAISRSQSLCTLSLRGFSHPPSHSLLSHFLPSHPLFLGTMTWAAAGFTRGKFR